MIKSSLLENDSQFSSIEKFGESCTYEKLNSLNLELFNYIVTSNDPHQWGQSTCNPIIIKFGNTSNTEEISVSVESTSYSGTPYEMYKTVVNNINTFNNSSISGKYMPYLPYDNMYSIITFKLAYIKKYDIITLPFLQDDSSTLIIDWGETNGITQSPFRHIYKTDMNTVNIKVYTTHTSSTNVKYVCNVNPEDISTNLTKLVEVVDWDPLFFNSFNSIFYNCTFLESIPNKEISGKLTNISSMFRNCINFNYWFVSQWLLFYVTDISKIFLGASLFNIPINQWMTSSVLNMSESFSDASSFNQDLSMWDVRKVTDMNSMFNNAISFNQPLNQWKLSSINNMSYMFQGATSFNQDISSWLQYSTNKVSIHNMFHKATLFNQPLNVWNISNVTDLSYMFSDAKSFNQPLDTWNTGNVINMSYMFNGATSFNQDISMWNFSNVKNFDYFLSNSGMDTNNFDNLILSLFSQFIGQDINKPKIVFAMVVELGADGLTYSPQSLELIDILFNSSHLQIINSTPYVSPILPNTVSNNNIIIYIVSVIILFLIIFFYLKFKKK